MAVPPVTQALVYTTITVFVAIVSRKIIKLYTDWWNLPPGPFPLPLIGNIHVFRKNLFAHEVVNDLAAKYGPVVTIFAGHTPVISVTDPEIGLQVLKKHTFAGRPKMFMEEMFMEKGSIDIVLADFGKEWEALRKVGHSAARKYAVSPQLAPSVTGIVDRAIEKFAHEPIDSDELFGLITSAILAEAVFGKKYEFDDPEFVKWRHANNVPMRENKAFMLIVMMPVFRHVLRRAWREIRECIVYQKAYIRRIFEESEATFTEGKNDTFCDAIIAAKNEAEAEENWMTAYLHPENLRNAIFDLFSAGSETTKTTLRWIFLFMAQQPEMQERMRAEVVEAVDPEESVGLQHRLECGFTCAFINECMRLKSIVPMGFPHKVTVDVELNGHRIPEGTMIQVNLQNALTCNKMWPLPLAFRPDRFLDSSGKFVSKPNPFFIPFGDGRRSCPGNKLALNDIFLVVARFLQKTEKIEVVGGVTDELMRGDLKTANAFVPSLFSLKFTLSKS